MLKSILHQSIPLYWSVALLYLSAVGFYFAVKPQTQPLIDRNPLITLHKLDRSVFHQPLSHTLAKLKPNSTTYIQLAADR